MTREVQCPWCRSRNRGLDNEHCDSCGGALPAMEGSDRGPPPPDPPRRLPRGYKKRVRFANPTFWIGFMFVVVFFWAVIFPIIGVFLLRAGIRAVRPKLRALELGRHAPGEITSVDKDTSVSDSKGRHPWKIAYAYQVDGHARQGWEHAYDAIHGRMQPGDRFWVVHGPDTPDQSALWPPVG